MSSGGMEWAYRVVQANALDPLAKLVVLHLGWRDHPNQRTDKGISRALGLHRTSVRRVTAALAENGLIARRSGQWVACETIAIVGQEANAPRPDKASSDRGAHEVPPRKGGAHEVPPEGHMRCPEKGTSGAPKRKEKIEKPRARENPPCKGAISAPASGAAPRPEGRAQAQAAQAGAARPDPWTRASQAAALGLPWVDPSSGVWRSASEFPESAQASSVAPVAGSG